MPTALLIVDVQNDFTEGGALGVVGGASVARRVTEYLASDAEYDLVVASRDWHDADNDNGGHFATAGPPDFVTTWPVHCVAGTTGAEYHPDLVADAVDVHVRKGQGVPAYSMFEGTTDDGAQLSDVLANWGSPTSTWWASRPTTAYARPLSMRSAPGSRCGCSPTSSPASRPNRPPPHWPR